MAKIEPVAVDVLKRATIIRTESGEIRRFDKKLQLSVEDGSLVKMPGMSSKVNGKWIPLVIPTAKGYMDMAGACGLFLHHPDSVTVNGEVQPNGYTDDRQGKIYFRSKCGGYTDSGQPFVTDRTVVFDINDYNLQDLLAKSNNDKYTQYFEIFPAEYDDNGRPTGGPTPKEGERWAAYPIDERTFLWVNVQAPPYRAWAREQVNRRKNAIRTCQTFADRNAITAHPAIPRKRKFSTDSAIVDCTLWYAAKGSHRFDGSIMELDPIELLSAGSDTVQVDELQEAQDITNDIETVKAEEAASPVDPDSSVDDAEDALGQEEAGGTADAADAGAGVEAQIAELVSNIKKAKGMKSVAQYKKACASLDLPVMKERDLPELPLAALIQLHKLLAA